jgi:hypothetical protein
VYSVDVNLCPVRGYGDLPPIGAGFKKRHPPVLEGLIFNRLSPSKLQKGVKGDGIYAIPRFGGSPLHRDHCFKTFTPYVRLSVF